MTLFQKIDIFLKIVQQRIDSISNSKNLNQYLIQNDF